MEKPRFYHGFLHLVFTFTILFILIFKVFSALQPLVWADLEMFLVLFLIVDLTTYLMRAKKIQWVHNINHHGLFVPDAMVIDGINNLYKVLLSPVIITGLVSLIASISGLLYIFVGFRTALIFALVALGYLMAYELIHLTSHLGFHKVPFVGKLAAHHRTHHGHDSNGKNFGIVTTIWDHLFKTKASA